MTSGISFIIPAYNCQDTLRAAVQSIFEGNMNPGDEIVIVNDASSDNTQKVIEELKDQYRSILAVQHCFNKGTAGAGRNTGIDNARNSLYFCLDADNILFPNSVPMLRDFLVHMKADAAAFGEVHFFRETPQNVTHKWIFKPEISPEDALAGHVWPGPSGNYMFTRESWIKAGRCFEPSLDNQTLDSWTFAIRQLLTGSKMVTLSQTHYLHRYGIRSHFVREAKKGNRSLAALVGLMPLLDLIDDGDVDYMMSREGRYTWFEQIETHPIRIKGRPTGRSGQATAPRLKTSLRVIHTLRNLYKRLWRG